MSLNKINLLYFYNQNIPDSLQLAQQYQNIHNLDNSQIIGINCSQNQILNNYSQFQTEIQSQVITQINLYGNDVYAIVFGYKVPRGFYDETDIISTTSRISRINHTYVKKELNPLYNRKYFRLYNEQQDFQIGQDIQQAIICSHIDGKDKQTVKNTLYRTKELFNQKLVNGRLYLDNISSQQGNYASLYTQQLNDFLNYSAPDLNIPICSTSSDNPYLYYDFSLLFQDSFAWLRNQGHGSLDMFRSSNTPRVLFYNADSNSGYSIRESQTDLWMQLAIEKDYCCAFGAMSDPTIQGYLSPQVLFRNLNNGASIGQSMILSSKYLNWTISFFGDPLLNFIFPNTVQNTLYLQNNLSRTINRQDNIKILFQDAARLFAYNYLNYNKKQNIANIIAYSDDMLASYDLIIPSVNLQNETDINGYNLESFINTLKDYLWLQVVIDTRNSNNLNIQEMSNLDQYLKYYSIKISNFIGTKLDSTDEDNLIPEGQWNFIYTVKHQSLQFEQYYFQLQISDVSDFTNIIFNISSNEDFSNWYYQEYTNGQYINFTKSTLGSNYNGLKIKYISTVPQYLTSGEIYYFRIRQVGNSVYSYDSYSDIIWS